MLKISKSYCWIYSSTFSRKERKESEIIDNVTLEGWIDLENLPFLSMNGIPTMACEKTAVVENEKKTLLLMKKMFQEFCIF